MVRGDGRGKGRRGTAGRAYADKQREHGETRLETPDELGTGSACAPELTVIPRKWVRTIGRQSNPRTAHCQCHCRHQLWHCSPAAMFPAKGLFAALPCPDKEFCRRPTCLFSHDPNAKEVQLVHIPVDLPKETLAASSSSAVQPKTAALAPNKRPLSSQAAGSSTSSNASPAPSEPPRKLQRTGPTKRPVAVPTATHTSVSRRLD